MTHDSPYHGEYKPIDRFVYLNTDDKDLFQIEVDQLKVVQSIYKSFSWDPPSDFPDIKSVHGYGLPPDKQKFEREVVPQSLVELERSVRLELKPKKKSDNISPARRELRVIELFWERLDHEQERFSEEIEWLRKMWYYRLFGKYTFINGKVTWIPPEYWFYLNFWFLNNNRLPDYRDRDRRWAVSFKFAYTTTETFRYIDEQTGLPVANAYGKYDMLDTGNRVIFFVNYLKARRVGDTSKIECFGVEGATRRIKGKMGIQGMDDDNATTVFQEHCVQPFVILPVFWKPVFDSAGGIFPKTSLVLDDMDDVGFGLHSMITFATSSDKAKFDGKFLHFFHGDEFGKMARSNVNDVVGVVKFCLATGGGSNIHGLGAITSTVDEIDDKSAGENFMLFCNRSHFERRDANGQTESGAINVFFKAEDGLEGFIGPYGESVIETPTPEQARFIGKNYGARKFIDNKIASFRRNRDWNGLALFRRTHPQCFADCFVPPPSAQVLRRDLIEGRISVLENNKELQAVRGDLFWINGADSKVGWIPNPENGKFYLSKRFDPGEANQKLMRDGMWWPRYMDRYLASADTFGIDKPQGRKSNGSILVTWLRDITVDPLDKDLDLVQSDRDILTYSGRPETVSEYCEDCLMASVFTGAMMYPERNKENVIDHFRRRNYGGYLLYDIDRNTGKPKPSPGFWNKNELMDAAIRWLAEDIVKNINRYNHLDLLYELLDFGGRSYLTNMDLTVAKLGTLIGKKNAFYEMVTGVNNSISVEGFIPWYKE